MPPCLKQSISNKCVFSCLKCELLLVISLKDAFDRLQIKYLKTMPSALTYNSVS